MKQRIFAVLLGALTLAWASAVRAAERESFEPGTGKYILVLKDPRTDVDDPATGKKKAKEPDVVKHGGKVLHKKDATRIIKLPNKKASALRNEENVAFLQRVWLGESQADWGQDELTSSMKSESDAVLDALETNLTWETGQYLYDGSGNIKQIGNDTYHYDAVGRLKQAVVKGVTETYQYDSFGNLIEKSISGLPGTIQVDPSSNRLKGETYDAAGNLTTQAGQPRYQYDSFSMITKVDKQLVHQRIIYGPDDERIGVLVQEGVLSRWKIRDFSGKVLREFKSDDQVNVWQWTEDYVYGDGRLLGADRDAYYGGKRHFHTDHLGSVRMITNQSRQRISVHEFYPFGVEQTDATQEYNRFVAYSDGDFRSEPMKFTGHERDWHGWLNVDNDEYLDYMHARYYDPNLGRFLSVDPGRDWDSTRPQSWNLYVYARNSPLLLVDPTGLAVYVFNSFAHDPERTPETTISATAEATVRQRVEDAGGHYYGQGEFTPELIAEVSTPENDVILLGHSFSNENVGNLDLTIDTGQAQTQLVGSGLSATLEPKSLSLLGCGSSGLCNAPQNLSNTPGVSLQNFEGGNRMMVFAGYLAVSLAKNKTLNQSTADAARRSTNRDPMFRRDVAPLGPVVFRRGIR